MLHALRRALTALGRRCHSGHSTCCGHNRNTGASPGTGTTAPHAPDGERAAARRAAPGTPAPARSASLPGSRAQPLVLSQQHPPGRSAQLQQGQVKHLWRSQNLQTPSRGFQKREEPTQLSPPAPPAHGADTEREKSPTPEGFCHGGEQPRPDPNTVCTGIREGRVSVERLPWKQYLYFPQLQVASSHPRCPGVPPDPPPRGCSPARPRAPPTPFLGSVGWSSPVPCGFAAHSRPRAARHRRAAGEGPGRHGAEIAAPRPHGTDCQPGWCKTEHGNASGR